MHEDEPIQNVHTPLRDLWFNWPASVAPKQWFAKRLVLR